MGKTQKPNLPLAKNMVVLFTISGVLLLLGVAFYFITVETVDNDSVWETNIREKCPEFFENSDSTISRFYSEFILASFG